MLLVVVGDGGDVLGQQVHVLHGQHRQFDTRHAADLACPEATGVDHVVAADGALHLAAGCLDDLDLPTFGGSSQRADPTVAVDGGAVVSGALCVGVGDAGGIDVTLVGVVHRPHEVLLLEEWHELLRLGDADEFSVHPEVATASVSHAQPVHALLGVSEHQPAGEVDAAVPAGERFDLLVELDRVLLQLGDVGVAVEGVHAPGRMPGRTGRELRALEKDDVGPAVLGQVVQHTGADDASADHNDTRVGLHSSSVPSPLEVRRDAAFGDSAIDKRIDLFEHGGVHGGLLVFGEQLGCQSCRLGVGGGRAGLGP